MIPAAFDYIAPASLAEALEVLGERGDSAKIIAGGQSLLPILRMRLNAPDLVVDLGKVAELRGVFDDGPGIVVGAMTTYSDFLADPLAQEHAGVLVDAVETIADPQIRHRGTIGGALAHADPAGDVGAPALAMEAEFVIVGPRGQRVVAGEDFFEDNFTTAVGDDEILAAVRLTKQSGWGHHYEKFVRVSHQWSVVAVAAAVRVEGDAIAEARIGLTNMGTTPVRARACEEALVGSALTEEAVGAACAGVAEGLNPPSDLNADADYRRHLATVLTRRAVLAAAGA
ncbi:carbon-monoxide dehydrogenase medium subunit [Kineosphaera limosa]|uniref:Putative carbon monoxide dehydrogenase medium subunit n=1 Tax=Kineosphaera limosa NBRC 100340 TaxID=1184609 RepID=K6WUM7_9MICO|nr:xanthine dehydrogenase family protein subunit M [Kineosphaera limosa]NYE00600.1 carbon-monoxide dehydrogenase medium subunit [Kineosphaera limosa]GAB97546.1 putative carbon monoxide dehydrogenase medium subunit [Kineosphaera limosa NBRC 100340]